MAEKRDDKEIVSFQEFMMSNAIQIDAVTQLFIEKGVFTERELFAKLKEVQTQYHSKVSIRQ